MKTRRKVAHHTRGRRGGRSRRPIGRELLPVFMAMMLVAAIAFCLSSCTNEEGNCPAKTELRLSAGIAAHTRANDNDWQSTQIIPGRKVYAWADETPAAAAPIQAWQLTAEAGGALEPAAADIKFYSETSEMVSVYAMHGNFDAPGITTNMAFPATLTHTVAADQSTEAAYANSDLLYATAINQDCTGEDIPLTFYHMLSKIEVALKEGSGITDTQMNAAGTTVRILNTRPKVAFTPKKEAISEQAKRQSMLTQPTDAAAPITIGKTPSADLKTPTWNQAVIVPMYMPVHTPFIEVKMPDIPEALICGLPEETTFLSGMKYRYKVTVSRSNLTISPATIAPWGNTLERTGTAEVDKAQRYTEGELKPGDYLYTDRTTSDGGLRAINTNGTVADIADPKPGPDPGKGTVVGIVFKVGAHVSDDTELYDGRLSAIRGYAVALNNASADNDNAPWDKRGNTDIQTGPKDGFDGYSNSKKMWESIGGKNFLSPENFHALQLCVLYSPTAPGNTSGWYLPSAGQWVEIRKLRDLIDGSIEKANGRKLVTLGNTWSSSQIHHGEADASFPQKAWYMFPGYHPDNYTIGPHNHETIAYKTYKNQVRAAITF